MSAISLPCPTCQHTVPVQWVKDEQQWRYNRHYLADGQVRCPTSGEPVKR